MFISFWRIIYWGWQGFKRNSGASIATSVMMVVVLSLVTSLYFLRYLTDSAVAFLEDKLALTIYFKREVLEDQILNAKLELERLPAVEKVVYISKEEALRIFTQKHQDNILIEQALAAVGANPLLSHLDIKATTPDQYQVLAEFLSEGASFKDAIDHINFSQLSPIIARVQRITSGLTGLGLLLTFTFSFMAFLVGFNTIRLAIFSLKDEIQIMRLVGASNFYIQGPLLVQIIIASLIASFLIFGITALATYSFNPKVEVFLPGVDIFSYFVNNIPEVLLLNLGVSISLGIFSSLVAMRKYLEI